MRNRHYSRSVPDTADAADLPAASVRAGPSHTVVRLTGEWDVTVCDRLHALLAAQLLAGTRHLVVDLSEVTFLDLSCLYALLEGGRMAHGADGTMQLVSPQPVVVRLMTLLGVDRLFAVRTDVVEATGLGGAYDRLTRIYPACPV